jgi:hypothetical protein
LVADPDRTQADTDPDGIVRITAKDSAGG